MDDKKTIQFANFNVTFGNEEQAMLTHFKDIIYPAFTAGLVRGSKEDRTRYSFIDIQVKKINEEYVLTGNFVKDTQYDIHTLYRNNILLSAPSTVPTSPYSRFIIFLNNHRMILILNESYSPNIVNFQSTVRTILDKFLYSHNKKSDQKLPSANVNIVNIPLKTKITAALKDVDKITELKLSFFPLNNDLNPVPLGNYIDEELKALDSRRANLRYLSPKSKENVAELIDKIGDTAKVLVKTKNNDGSTKNFSSDTFKYSQKIVHDKNVEPADDDKFVKAAKETGMIKEPSPDNFTLYQKYKDFFKRLAGK